ncbi:MAG: ATP:cob(I)alamin adenosyltransferase, partial [Ginsengibacter sp.]
CVCRRAERCCVKLNEKETKDDLVIKYLNRLSDYLFTLARYTSLENNAPEVIWKARV